MTSDFDHDEIQDSAFPVEFNDENNSLDMYGVWVKSGPRDALSVTETRADSDEIEASSLADLPDFSDFDTDLPSFDTTEPETLPDDTITDEFTLPDFDDTPSGNEEPVSVTDTYTDEIDHEISVEEDFTSMEFDDIPLQETLSDEQIVDVESFPADLPEEVPPVQEIPVIAEQSMSDISFENFGTDVSEENISFEETPFTLEQEEEQESSTFSDISIEDIPLSVEENEYSEDVAAPVIPESGSIDESSVSEFEISDFTGEDTVTEEITPDIFEKQEKTDIPSNTALPSDDDFSSFLDDLNSGSASIEPVSEDLDSFIDSFNELGGLTGEETEKLFDDTEPVELDLEFDEDFIADNDMIRATGANITENEFMSSEFGVELIDETGSVSSFDDMFDSIPDMSEKVIDEVEPSFETPVSEGIEETNEFDDLLQSFESTPSMITNTDKSKTETVKQEKQFSLSVTEEDNLESVSAPVTDESDDDSDVSLFDTGSEVMNETSVSADDTKEIVPDISVAEPEISFSDSPDENSISDLAQDIGVEFETMESEENLVNTEQREYNSSQTDATESINIEEPIVESGISDATMEDSVSLDFDDVSALQHELSDMTPETGDAEVMQNDKSTELLLQIANELSTIKGELADLKQELAGLKTKPSVSVTDASLSIQEDSGDSGFFSDDDPDDAIALTGDELNNILITADFTEEKNEVPQEMDSQDSPIETDTNTEVDIESVDLPVTDSAETDFDIPDTLPDSVFSIEDAVISEEVEVQHVTKVEDDLSYLEESDISDSDMDNLAIDEPELEIIDFDDENLQEPELDEFNIDLTGLESDFPEEQILTKTDESIDTDIAVEPISEEAAIDISPQIEVPQETSVDPFETEISFEDDESQMTEIDTNSIDVQVAPDSSEDTTTSVKALPLDLKDEIKSVLTYMDQLLESLPEEKIQEFARSEHFEVYKKLFEELGIS